LSPGWRSGERNNQFVGEVRILPRFCEGYALDGEADGVESDFGGDVAKNGERVRDFAENFFLVEVEAQGNLRMLQIIVAAAGNKAHRRGFAARR